MYCNYKDEWLDVLLQSIEVISISILYTKIRICLGGARKGGDKDNFSRSSYKCKMLEDCP